jgi:hypothetical protein
MWGAVLYAGVRRMCSTKTTLRQSHWHYRQCIITGSSSLYHHHQRLTWGAVLNAELVQSDQEPARQAPHHRPPEARRVLQLTGREGTFSGAFFQADRVGGTFQEAFSGWLTTEDHDLGGGAYIPLALPNEASYTDELCDAVSIMYMSRVSQMLPSIPYLLDNTNMVGQ